MVDFPHEPSQHFCPVTHLDFHVEEVKEGKLKLGDLVREPPGYPMALRHLTEIVNRVFSGIRNYGVVAQISEIHPMEDQAATYLLKWCVEVSEDGENWTRVCEEPRDFQGLAALLTVEHPEGLGMLQASRWPNIEEAIQDNLQPGPEQEFLANAIEHLNRHNYRLAVVESITCLEIVLNDYLREFLATEKGIPTPRIKNFLRPEVGLHARVSALLDLTVGHDGLASIQLDHVLFAIEWRNKVVHRTGHLPDHLTEEVIRQRISSVFALAKLLAHRRDQLKAAPEMNKIAKALSEKYPTSNPKIFLVDRHRVAMLMTFFPFIVPEEEILKAIADNLSSHLMIRDPRFEPNKHLSIEYLLLPGKAAARWRNGQLEVLHRSAEEKDKAT